MRLRHFDVPPHLSVVFDLQGRDVQFLSQPLFKGRKPCFSFVGHRAEFVHFIVNARSQETAVPQAQRCLLIQSVADGFHHLVELLEPLAQVHQERVLTVFAPLCDGRHSFQCVGRGDQITRIAALISQLGCQSFHVSNPFERGSHPVQPPCRTSQRPNSGMTGLYGCWIGQRVKHPCLEQASPHGRAATVQGGEEATVVFPCQCGG